MIKQIELVVRRSILWLLAHSVRIRPPASLSTDNVQSILLLRHDRIGDAIISTPVLLRLRDRYPGARIDILLGEKNRTVAPLLGGISGVYIAPSSPLALITVVRELRARHYDVVVNLLLKKSAGASLLARMLRGGFTIGFHHPELAALYDFTVEEAPGLHIVEQTSRLLLPLGIEAIGSAPDLRTDNLAVILTAVDRHAAAAAWQSITTNPAEAIVINISASSDNRTLPDSTFIAIASALRSTGMRPVLVGAPGENMRLRTIAKSAGVAWLEPVGSLGRFAALLEKAAIVVTPDSSVVHISAALLRPTVMLTANMSTPNQWYPWGVPARVVIADNKLSELPAAIVVTEVRTLLEEIMASGTTLYSA